MARQRSDDELPQGICQDETPASRSSESLRCPGADADSTRARRDEMPAGIDWQSGEVEKIRRTGPAEGIR